MCKKLVYLIGICMLSQMVSASPIPEETPGLPQMESIAYFPATRLTIDGDLSDWIASGAAWKYFDGPENVLRGAWGGPQDASIMWSVMWDDQFLYFAGVVWDDVYTQPAGVLQNWQADCIFLYFDADLNGERDNLLSLFLLEDPDDETAPLIPSARYWDVATPGYGPSPDGVDFTIIMGPELGLGDAGTIYEVAIRLDSLVNINPVVGGAFGLNVGKEEGNDTTHDGGKFICWTNQEPGDGGNQFPVNFEGPQVFLDTAEFEIPLDGAVDVPRDAALSWKAGKSAVAQDVYFGTDMSSVSDATSDNAMDVLASQGQAETNYDPEGLLDYGMTYYWRIDGVNDAEAGSPWKGHVWSFTVENYIIDDFEDYNDYPPNEVFMTWVDGFGDPTNGSTAGYPDPDFNIGQHYVETTIVHNGEQSMPLFYDNAAGISEATKTLSSDWSGFKSLVIWYHGAAENAAEPMYAALNGSAVINNEDADAVLVTEWTKWKISLEAFADQGVDLANVTTLTLGFGNKANPTAGGAGVVYFDDIGLSMANDD